METYQVLEKALALIEDGELARGGPGDCVNSFCSLSACYTASGEEFAAVTPCEHRAFVALQKAHRGHDSIVAWQDQAPKEEVVALFKKAIQEEKRKAGVLLEIPSECSETQRVYANV